MIKVYCYSKCTTCKKALKWLDENGIGHEVIDIKADHPEYHWRDCLDESERLMTGNRWRLFKLDMSFLGWTLLGMLAFSGVGEFWALSYQLTSRAVFYEQVKAEKDNLMDEYGMSTSGPVVYSR